ncbi:CITE1 protein, partial [Anthoscopus minutus]|nr:CITE1 protein [Anthoscopus minutus]
VPVVVAPAAPRFCGPPGGSQLPSQFVPAEAPHQSRAAGRSWSPVERGSPEVWGHSCGEPGPPASPTQTRTVGLGPFAGRSAGALVVELGLNRADELPELWLGHHEVDPPSDLLAG